MDGQVESFWSNLFNAPKSGQGQGIKMQEQRKWIDLKTLITSLDLLKVFVVCSTCA